MAIADDVITLPRLRDAIGGVGSSEDTLLSGFRNSAITWIERWTNRKIISIQDFESDPDSFDFQDAPVPFIEFKVTDISGDNFRINYSTASSPPQGARTASPMTINVSDTRVNLSRDGVVIYVGEGDSSWRDVMRYDHPTPTITCNRGMDSTDIPAPWGDAVALIARALYDGSAYDDIASNSTLQMLLSPWRIQQFTRTIR